MIKVLFTFSVFKYSSSLVSFCFPVFKNIPEIFSFILEMSLITKILNERNSACNMLIVIFSKLSCSVTFPVDVSPSFGISSFEGVSPLEFDSVSLLSERTAVVLSSEITSYESPFFVGVFFGLTPSKTIVLFASMKAL